MHHDFVIAEYYLFAGKAWCKMLFTKLKLNYFGRFHNREIELKPGINLIYGENEAGKSTLHTFIKGMLFGIERMRGRGAASKEDTYTRYLPWDYPGAYSGQMDIKINEKEYRLQRSFHANDKCFTILDLETGREVKLKEGVISELLPGLTESTFKNTISIEQLKAQTDSELASQMRDYITNLSIAKSNEVNVAKAVSFLTEQRKVLDATQNVTILKKLQSEIEEGIEKEERIDELTLMLRVLLTEEEELKVKREAAAASMDNEAAEQIEQLPAIIEKYSTYKELSGQSTPIKSQMEELSKKIIIWEKVCGKAEALKEDLREAASLSTELPEYERKRLELKRESVEALRSGIRKNMMISLFPSFVLALVMFILIKERPTQIAASSGFLLIGG
ncbi:MAG TPA: AAA family ATPase, partial [Mobilitalea sp.]|nr:AAA family ATPase [Mobilitalea sp.]